MGRVFDAYQKGQQGGMSRGMNMLSMEQMLDKKRRDTALRNALASAYTPAAPADMPYAAGVEPRKASFDLENAFESMYQNNLAPEAFAMQMQMASADAPLKKVMLEHKLKQDMINSAFDRFGNLRGDNADPSMSMKIGPQGPEMTYDPSKGRKLRIDEATHHFNTGQPIGSYSAGAPDTSIPSTASVPAAPPVADLSGLSPKMRQQIKSFEAKELTKERIADKKGLETKEMGAAKTHRLVDRMLSHKGIDDAFGMLTHIPALRGSARADFETLKKQLESSIFIENRAKLKGGGSITDFEGTKAAEAEVAISQATSKEAFVESVKEYQYWVDRGLAKLRQKLGGSAYKAGEITIAPNGMRVKILSVKPDGTPDDVEPY